MAFYKFGRFVLPGLALMLLVGGLGASVFVSQQKQENRSHAAELKPGDLVQGGITLYAHSGSGPAPVTVNGLIPGATYNIRVSGHYMLDKDANNLLNIDAMWGDVSPTVARQCYCVEENTVSFNGWRGSMRALMDAPTTTFHTNHVYMFSHYPIEGANSLTMQINDSNYADNDGYLTVDIYLDSLPASGDTTPPSVPTGLTATPVSQSEIDLAWT